jgi:DNA-binding MarR family transcriptional regulator
MAEGAFSEVFQSAEDCFLAAFEEGLERLSEVVRQAAAREELVGRPAAAARARSRAAELEVPLSIPFHHRSALVLRAIAGAPRSSNREIAEAAGLTDKGQTSHLLRRLAQRGLIEKVPPRNGSRRENAWLLTPSGRRVIRLIGDEIAIGPRASANATVGKAA